MDDRVKVLLMQRSVQCTIRKSPKYLQVWFRLALEIYNQLWERLDKGVPPVKGILNELFTMIKYVALPNNLERRIKLVDEKWLPLKEKIDGL